MIRFDLPDGRSVVAETSLRAWWAATVALAAKHGEPHMQVQPSSERVKQLEIALRHVSQQLVDCQRRHGEPVTFNLEAADREYEQGRE